MEHPIRITRINGELIVELAPSHPSILLDYGMTEQYLMNTIQEDGPFKVNIILDEEDVPLALYYLDQAGYAPEGQYLVYEHTNYSTSSRRSRSRRSRSRFRSRRQRDEPYSRLKPRTHPRGWGRPGFSRK
ncbi:PREDICTED: uncharacterized protein LOC109585458 [Amphimedon queenslandica]|uniref:Uncharacterized protein n=1 Tax=Amphimedon queenslandica TaxID=400682 RepID=A0AAN0JJ96_AMPQE|nr:PREDICTED: uncharacterized protein LOC109585458 [Amphimedon queenslandica]|eukprot:XP_019857105.1 PREDICTED: uncharacterized protein LOC109585458 [Amphimedon queenslandica]